MQSHNNDDSQENLRAFQPSLTDDTVAAKVDFA
jgi:hypothetical protein